MGLAGAEILRFPSDSGCFGCSDANPTGLHLVFRRDGDMIRCDTSIADRFHGAPGIAHGGIVASILDEISCAAIFFMRSRHVVTGELTVRYEKPCPVKTVLSFQARIADESHGKYGIVLAESICEGVIAARSTGKFFYVERAVSSP